MMPMPSMMVDDDAVSSSSPMDEGDSSLLDALVNVATLLRPEASESLQSNPTAAAAAPQPTRPHTHDANATNNVVTRLSRRPVVVPPTPCAWLDQTDPMIVHPCDAGSFDLPSLDALSDDRLSLNQAYRAFSGPPSSSAFVSRPDAPSRTATTTSSSSSSSPPPSIVIARFHVRLTDSSNRRGTSKTGRLVFAVRPASASRGAISAAAQTVLVDFRCYGYKMLMNRHAHYTRGRFGCVMLSPSLRFHITARNSQPDLVLMRNDDWPLQQQQQQLPASEIIASMPGLALASDVRYELTFVADTPDVVVECVQQVLHGNLSLEWGHGTQAASTPTSTSAASSSPGSVVFDSPTTSIHTAPSLSPSASSSMHQSSPLTFATNHTAAATRVSCQHCRAAKARCDNQRPCTRCVRTHRAATCIDLPRPDSPSSSSSADSGSDDGGMTDIRPVNFMPPIAFAPPSMWYPQQQQLFFYNSSFFMPILAMQQSLEGATDARTATGGSRPDDESVRNSTSV